MSLSTASFATVVTVRFFAGARDAVGAPAEQVAARTVGELRRVLVDRHPALAGVLPRCSLLTGGVRRDDDHVLADGVTVDVLPPFAGG